MQRYQSHKIVEAAKLTHFEIRHPSGGVPGRRAYAIDTERIAIEIPLGSEDRFPSANPDRNLRQIADAHQPLCVDSPPFVVCPFDPGYFLRYEDGFVSWSPTAAFERGYSLLGEEGRTATARPSHSCFHLGARCCRPNQICRRNVPVDDHWLPQRRWCCD